MIYDGAPSMHLPEMVAAIQERLAANYRCLYLNSPAMVAGLRTYLIAAGIDLEREVARGSLLLSSGLDHLVDGRFQIDAMLDSLAAAVRLAISEGYAGLWASGDVLWEMGNDQNLQQLLPYELALQDLIDAEPALCGICQYHRSVLPESAIQDALYAHKTVRIHGSARENPYYRQPRARGDSSRPRVV